jgi:CheY-like chemotaxis protein
MSVLSPSGTKPYTILVSDDDPAVRRSLQLVLKSRGYAVRGYTTASALAIDPRAPCADCVIVDYNMPDIDGLALLNKLRCEGWCGRSILISAYYDDALVARALAAGVDEVVAKPFVGRAVLEALDRFKQEEQARPAPKSVC